MKQYNARHKLMNSLKSLAPESLFPIYKLILDFASMGDLPFAGSSERNKPLRPENSITNKYVKIP